MSDAPTPRDFAGSAIKPKPLKPCAICGRQTRFLADMTLLGYAEHWCLVCRDRAKQHGGRP